MNAGVRFLGHPVHVMLLHFPVAFWPAHFGLRLLAEKLPAGVGAVAGFWLLVAGTAVGWLAAGCGALDLLALAAEGDSPRLRSGFIHACVNGTALVGFTGLAVLEVARYPDLGHGLGFLTAEAALLAMMAVGNYFGGAVAWPNTPTSRG